MAKDKSDGTAKLKKAARKIRKKTLKAAADHPLVAEVVAAALVGAAAALRNPAKARQLAESAAEEITAAGKKTGAKGAALWMLALDVARRSLDSTADEQKEPKAPKPPKPAKPPKPEKPAKPAKPPKPPKQKKKGG